MPYCTDSCTCLIYLYLTKIVFAEVLFEYQKKCKKNIDIPPPPPIEHYVILLLKTHKYVARITCKTFFMGYIVKARILSFIKQWFDYTNYILYIFSISSFMNESFL